MKVIAINGSPRKNWNTHKLLNAALEGAKSMGAETEIIHLYDLNYTGCRSCFACKRKGLQTAKCFWKDDLSPVIDKILSSDAVIFGSPIYVNDITVQLHALIERLEFIMMTYDDYSINLFKGKVNAGYIFTMNASKEYYEKGYKSMLDQKIQLLHRLNGTILSYESFNTLQFKDYSKYHTAVFDEKIKKERHETQFPIDLENAFKLGKEILE